MFGVFVTGKIMNPKLARSRYVGGMTWGLSMALLKESVLDEQHGDYVNHDLAQYRIPVSIDVHIIEETDSNIGPAQAKGIGEIGIAAAAAIANAVHHATGSRVRGLPIRMDRLINATQASTSREKGDLQ
jgi:xanthine dehydrogenase YagR molybdenum-binding subunit